MRHFRVICGFWMVCLVALESVADEPNRSPSGLLPAAGLRFYLKSDGLQAHDAAWKTSAAHDILVKTSSGSTMLDVERQTLDKLFGMAFAQSKLTGAGFLALQDDLVARGFTMARYEEDGEGSTVFVLHRMGDDGGTGRFETVLRGFLRMAADDPLPRPTPIRGRDLRGFGAWNADEAPAKPAEPVIANIFAPPGANRPPTALTWWREGDALFVVNGPRVGLMDGLLHPDRVQKDLPAIHRARVSAVLDAIEAKRPNVTTLPSYLAAKAEGREIAGFEPSGLFFAEAKPGQGVLQGLRGTLPAVGTLDEFTLFEAIDLMRADRIVGRWGFRGKSLVTDVRLLFADGWNGPLVKPGFAKDQLPPIPTASGVFAISAIDQARIVERFAPFEAGIKPEASQVFTALNQAIGEASTPELRESFFRHLGPTWSLHACAGAGDDPKGSALPAFLADYRDLDGLEKDLAALAKGINSYFRAKLQDAGDAQRPAIGLERLAEPERGYRLVSASGLSSKLSEKIEPTLLIGRSHVAFAPSLAQARAAIAAESNPAVKWSPTGELARSFEALPANLVFLSVGNSRDSAWPEALASFRQSAPIFLGKFLRFDQPAAQPDLLEVLGVPKAARAGLARADELRALIHPSVLAASVEDRSFRVLWLEALPLGCLGLETEWSPQGAMNINVKFAPGR